jgi:hypothetical protein
MTKLRFWGAGLLGALAACAVPHAALAQASPPTPAASLDARTEAQKAAFLAMPETDRKAAQDALGWLGLYNGAVDGAFGKRTRDSILAYQASVAAPADGVVSPAQLAALKAAAQKVRAAVGFELVDERTSGERIGAPLKILDKIAIIGDAATLEKAGGSVTLAFLYKTGAKADLAALYAELIADEKGRKITYKAMKADEFIVVAGELAGRKFYTRYAKAPANWPAGAELRGFTFAYPSDQAADLDKVALAVANAFEPFPASPVSLEAANARPPSGLTMRDIVKVASAASAAPPAPPSATPEAGPKPPPSPPELTATGLIVAPGQALTAIAGDCANPMVDGKAAKVLRADGASGLALLGGDFGAGAPAPRFGAAFADLVVLALAPGATAGKTTLEASAATPVGDSAQAIVAPLTGAAGGAPVFDRRGALEAVVAPIKGEPRRVGGVALAAPHAVIGLAAIKRFLGDAGADAPADAPALDLGEIASRERASIATVVCRP